MFSNFYGLISEILDVNGSFYTMKKYFIIICSFLQLKALKVWRNYKHIIFMFYEK